MTENRHPIEQHAIDTTETERFCEFLDATAAMSNGWPNSRWSARQWVCEACGVENLGGLGVDPAAAKRWREVFDRYRAWDANEVLGV